MFALQPRKKNSMPPSPPPIAMRDHRRAGVIVVFVHERGWNRPTGVLKKQNKTGHNNIVDTSTVVGEGLLQVLYKSQEWNLEVKSLEL